MPTNIRNSFAMAPKPAPFIITLFTAAMNHLAGMMCENHWSTSGILSMGKSIPENIITGISKTIPEISSATSWVDTTVEMSIPNAKATNM